MPTARTRLTVVLAAALSFKSLQFMAFVFGLATIKTMPGYSFIKFALFMVDAFVAFMVPIISLGNHWQLSSRSLGRTIRRSNSCLRFLQSRWVIPTAESLEYQTQGRD